MYKNASLLVRNGYYQTVRATDETRKKNRLLSTIAVKMYSALDVDNTQTFTTVTYQARHDEIYATQTATRSRDVRYPTNMYSLSTYHCVFVDTTFSDINELQQFRNPTKKVSAHKPVFTHGSRTSINTLFYNYCSARKKPNVALLIILRH